MSQEPLTKEEWYERVRQEGKVNVIKQEMIRLGFWSEEELSQEEKELARLEEEEIAVLEKELRSLRGQLHSMNLDQLLKKVREKRIEESKRRREERKRERAQAAKEAQQRWREYQQTHLVHLGKGLSSALENLDCNESQLQQNGLPLLTTPQQLADEIGITLSQLKWLTYHREVATLSHYYTFTIPKKSGGQREISAPKRFLRRAQGWVKEQILDQLVPHPAAYGFVRGRSVVDHARCHIQQSVVVKMDLKDFFPSITFYRVRGFFVSLGYSPAIGTVLALLCTEPPREKVEFDGKFYYVAIGERRLPQGAATSPPLTNLICRRLDQRLQGLAEKEGFLYSRYADDMTFSCPQDRAHRLGALLKQARHIVRFEGFAVNEKKTRILRKGRQQKVTGIVVNEKTHLPRTLRKRFRAMLHNVEQNGLQAENRENHPDFWAYLQGFVNYAFMVRPELGEQWQAQLERIAKKQGVQ